MSGTQEDDYEVVSFPEANEAFEFDNNESYGTVKAKVALKKINSTPAPKKKKSRPKVENRGAKVIFVLILIFLVSAAATGCVFLVFEISELKSETALIRQQNSTAVK